MHPQAHADGDGSHPDLRFVPSVESLATEVTGRFCEGIDPAVATRNGVPERRAIAAPGVD